MQLIDTGTPSALTLSHAPFARRSFLVTHLFSCSGREFTSQRQGELLKHLVQSPDVSPAVSQHLSTHNSLFPPCTICLYAANLLPSFSSMLHVTCPDQPWHPHRGVEPSSLPFCWQNVHLYLQLALCRPLSCGVMGLRHEAAWALQDLHENLGKHVLMLSFPKRQSRFVHTGKICLSRPLLVHPK